MLPPTPNPFLLSGPLSMPSFAQEAESLETDEATLNMIRSFFFLLLKTNRLLWQLGAVFILRTNKSAQPQCVRNLEDKKAKKKKKDKKEPKKSFHHILLTPKGFCVSSDVCLEEKKAKKEKKERTQVLFWCLTLNSVISPHHSHLYK